jgi:hypothetical protein
VFDTGWEKEARLLHDPGAECRDDIEPEEGLNSGKCPSGHLVRLLCLRSFSRNKLASLILAKTGVITVSYMQAHELWSSDPLKDMEHFLYD